MNRRWKVTMATALAAATAAAPVAVASADTKRAGARTPVPAYPKGDWVLVAQEGFDRRLPVDGAAWRRDPLGKDSPWHVDQFDDDGDAFRAISDPDLTRQLATLDIYRKRVPFGRDGWLTAEVAAVDKDKDGRPDSQPGLSSVKLPDGEKVGLISEPSWDAGVLIRPTRPLPARYRVEVTLRGIDFGGKRDGGFEYDGKYNGYTQEPCKTGFPWTHRGALPGKTRCEYGDVKNENGFYYMTILDHANPAPHGNPGIHYRRKVIMDGYNSNASWSQDNGICNPKTGEIYSTVDGNFNGINAIFPRGDMITRTNNFGNEYYYKTACGEYSGEGTWGPDGQYNDILTSAELQPELLPKAKYTFAVERDTSGYTIEMSGPFRHVGQTTLRFHHKFVEDGRPIWHYNQTPGEYDGRFDQKLTHTGANGTSTTEHSWPAGSAYPDSFIIGDPHLNYYEGSARIDDIRLYVPKN
ncbi:hypothetical protein [Spirillospora sp. NPDC047279]|uniref:hypothetical protein n=1 Tax=Spirillospora sp. NPDC047279 TaxID=3155478 RepID=UPI0033DFF0AC